MAGSIAAAAHWHVTKSAICHAAGGTSNADGSCSDGPAIELNLPASHALQTTPPATGWLSLWVKWDPALGIASSQHLPLISLRSPVLATANVSGQLVPIRAQLAMSFGCHRPLGSVSAQLCIEVVLAKDSSPSTGQATVAQSLWFSSGWPWRWRDSRWHHVALLQVGPGPRQ
jgi:hypothetical protein